MSKRPKKRQPLEEILQSTSDTLFPEELGKAHIELNSRDCDGDTPLHVLLWRGDHYGAELLIDAGADIDAIGDMGQTPLHVALMKQNLRITRVLVSAGADTTIRSEFGQTAVEMAKDLGGDFVRLFK